jgi:large subunit ribosomal protein L15
VKLHDLKPAPGSHKKKPRVGRGIAAGQGKTAGRGTKGQKARAGGNLPAWFEGGQTPLHQRLPKLHGFKNPFRIEYEIVNLGDVARLVDLGVLESGELPATGAAGSKARTTKAAKSGSAAPVTVNQELLRAAGLVRTLDKPLKVLGGGETELSSALFVVADAFSASARAKIEAAGGSVNVLETTRRKTPAIGVDRSARAGAAPASAAPDSAGPSDEATSADESASEAPEAEARSTDEAADGQADAAAGRSHASSSTLGNDDEPAALRFALSAQECGNIQR